MQVTNVNIFRYDPNTDPEPYYKNYEIPWKQYLTVLEALHYVNDHYEQISFDHSCRGSLCGRCSVMLDGEAVLACYKTLKPGVYHTIEPLKGFPVIRDMLVDRSQMRRRLDASDLSMNTLKSLKPADAPKIDYDYYWNTLERLNMCRECGNCLAMCPVYAKDKENYLGPAGLAQIALRANDSMDESGRVFQAVMNGLFRCIGCGQCAKVCPSHIDHPELFRQLKQRAIDADMVPPEEGLQSLLKMGQGNGKLY